LQVLSTSNSSSVRFNSASATTATRGSPSCIRAQALASSIHAATTTTIPGPAST
jgi:hypothetical protein